MSPRRLSGPYVVHQMIFVNLPVDDLAKSRAFFTDLGYAFDEQMCDGEHALGLRLGQHTWAMLLRRDVFDGFHDESPVGPGQHEVLTCLSARSRGEVDELVDRAVHAGAREVRSQDDGVVYGRSYADPDGHIWEIIWMDAGETEGNA